MNLKKSIFELLKKLIAIENDFRLEGLVRKYKQVHNMKVDQDLSHSISEVDGLLGIHNIEEIGKYLANTIPPEERKPLFDNIFSSVLYDHKEAFMKPNKQFLEVLMVQSLYNNQDLK